MPESIDKSTKAKPNLPEETLRVMERMLKTPPKPHEKATKVKEPDQSSKSTKRKGAKDSIKS